ncbi:hypothetical protein FRB95_009778 [Tulasnella sp. JGI-2019a]|nr:hypothetical protein FRB95_009778 [Tulasnella sp. JGI-2019a]
MSEGLDFPITGKLHTHTVVTSTSSFNTPVLLDTTMAMLALGRLGRRRRGVIGWLMATWEQHDSTLLWNYRYPPLCEARPCATPLLPSLLLPVSASPSPP